MAEQDLRAHLGHAFRPPELLTHALTHRTYGANHNERPESVGAAVLNCGMAAVLFPRSAASPAAAAACPRFAWSRPVWDRAGAPRSSRRPRARTSSLRAVKHADGYGRRA